MTTSGAYGQFVREMDVRGIIGMAIAAGLAAPASAFAQPAGLRSDPQGVVKACLPPEQRQLAMSALSPAARLALMTCFQREAARQLNAQLPYRVDGATVLRSVATDGAQLTYLNDVDIDAAQVTAGQREEVIQSTRANACGQEGMRATMSHGGSYRYIWFDRSGAELMRTTIERC